MSEEIDFNKIDKARKILGLGEKATLKEIKNAYREKAKRYHPDFAHDKDKKEYEDIMKEINDAYKILMDYCENYEYSFKKEDIEHKDYRGYADWFKDDWLISKRQKNQEKDKKIKTK